jgi:2-polyprenyl-3-methyl-5-hydroxy-6-metoxy-1,4-benzoquinol methylase
MKINKCRNCYKSNLKDLFSLGKLSYTGKFSKNYEKDIKKTKITLAICNSCFLVQLRDSYNLKYLYNQSYGYRTGINKTMINHMKDIKKILCKKTKIKSGDYVLDIASNDGTLLNLYSRDIIKVGIDPLIKKYQKFYNNIQYKIPSFFSLDHIHKIRTFKKFKIITALSVFYDIENPNKFLKDINEVLDDNGVFLLEHADLASIIKNKMFDTICQEHITYYSSKIILNMLKSNNLRIFDIEKNNINGGSVQYFICKKNARFETNKKKLNNFLRRENKFQLEKIVTYKNFFNTINKIKIKLLNYLNELKINNKIIHGYGASTKGNVLLQFFNINKKYLEFIAERNPDKYNLFTPGTKIKIISEKMSRLKKPDYYLVLPWHFKNEILNREKEIIKRGTKFIFPLPEIKIY